MITACDGSRREQSEKMVSPHAFNKGNWVQVNAELLLPPMLTLRTAGQPPQSKWSFL